MADDDAPEEEVEEGEAWLATFADLMSLLMCFFVLLLSFSEMDLEKYRQIAGSLRLAFGVQREVVAEEPPKGVSVIAQEFSPGKPEPTAFRIMKQQGNDEARHRMNIVRAVESELETMLSRLREALSPEINDGRVDVVRTEDEVVVRISESESFASGSARLRPSFFPILDTIAEAVAETTGKLIVAGHSDNVPISTREFGSNWVLSSARAANVVHHFETSYAFNEQKIEIRAYADKRPLNDNDDPENRANNRRVEVIVSHADYLKGLRQSIVREYEGMIGPMPRGWVPPVDLPSDTDSANFESGEPPASAALPTDQSYTGPEPIESRSVNELPVAPQQLFDDDFRLQPATATQGDSAGANNNTAAPAIPGNSDPSGALLAPGSSPNQSGVAGAAAVNTNTMEQTEPVE